MDLAGSERCGPDHGGVQIKEANNINKSLGANNEIIYVFPVKINIGFENGKFNLFWLMGTSPWWSEYQGSHFNMVFIF